MSAIIALAFVTASCSSSPDDDAAPTSRSTASADASSESELKLVVIGDSIPNNSPDDCPGCTGFVERYAQALEKATGKTVTTSNLSQHNGLTLPMLMDELDFYEDTLSSADAILVGIAHNSIVLNDDRPCGTAFDETALSFEDWSMITPECSKAWVGDYRPQYDELFATIASWREGRPTLLRTINKYSDWVGWKDARLTRDQARRTVLVHDDWNKMLCTSARAHGFGCADVYHSFNGPRGTRPSGDLLAGDYTHPSDRGNERIAQVLVEQGFAPLA
jgi:hypothetical protein